MVPPPSAGAARAVELNTSGSEAIKERAIAELAAQALKSIIFSSSAPAIKRDFATPSLRQV
jgi:hypothetical protein